MGSAVLTVDLDALVANWRMLDRESAASVETGAVVKANGYGFQIEMTHKAWMKGFKIGEVPIVFEDRQEGTSKMSGNIVYEALWVVWTLAIRNGFRRKPKVKRET